MDEEFTGALCDKKKYLPNSRSYCMRQQLGQHWLWNDKNHIWRLIRRQEEKISVTETRMLSHIYSVYWEHYATK